MAGFFMRGTPAMPPLDTALNMLNKFLFVSLDDITFISDKE